MTAEQLVATLRERGVRLYLEDGALKYRAPAGAFTEKDRAAVQALRTEVLRLIGEGEDRQDRQGRQDCHAGSLGGLAYSRQEIATIRARFALLRLGQAARLRQEAAAGEPLALAILKVVDAEGTA